MFSIKYLPAHVHTSSDYQLNSTDSERGDHTHTGALVSITYVIVGLVVVND